MVEHVRSWWLNDILSREPANPEVLTQDLRTDVCIVGGGFTGLWTALHIKERDPSVDVTLVEKDICGGGASGLVVAAAAYRAAITADAMSVCDRAAG